MRQCEYEYEFESRIRFDTQAPLIVQEESLFNFAITSKNRLLIFQKIWLPYESFPEYTMYKG